MPFILVLNDMRSSQVQVSTNVCRADTKEELQALLDKEKVEPYTDIDAGNYHWQKFYRKGGPLEWFNQAPPDGLWGHGINEIPSEEDYVKIYADGARKRYQEAMQETPTCAEFMSL